MMSTETTTLREKMVKRQLAARGIHSTDVLAAMRKVRREAYVPSSMQKFAYCDRPLPIEHGQTISQPYIVALMVEALQLKPTDRVLEVGTGSGYAAAVLAELASEVFSMEWHQQLADLARERLRRDGYDRVEVRRGDGSLGWPEAAPFDGIVVAAGGPELPQALRGQLAIGGRLVIPVGRQVDAQRLLRVTRHGVETYDEEDLCGVRFVPLMGAEGWHATSCQ